ncbi:MAG TPA: hypothetical protein VNA14_03685 [Mycobacteriales bacterium]|nr:hypothetical protein [Mycobacteriales bacterium]
MRRAALPIGLALVSALAVPAGAGGAGCAAARTQPVEVETLQVSVVPDDRPRRAGEQVAIRVRVTRAVKPDSPVSPFTELLPVELASVYGILTSGARVLDDTANEADKAGWATLKFNLPATTRPGAVAIAVEARYALVGSVDCTEPYVVETGHGTHDAVVMVRR